MPVSGAVKEGARGDYNNDGYLDLFVVRYEGTNAFSGTFCE